MRASHLTCTPQGQPARLCGGRWTQSESGPVRHPAWENSQQCVLFSSDPRIEIEPHLMVFAAKIALMQATPVGHTAMASCFAQHRSAELEHWASGRLGGERARKQAEANPIAGVCVCVCVCVCVASCEWRVASRSRRIPSPIVFLATMTGASRQSGRTNCRGEASHKSRVRSLASASEQYKRALAPLVQQLLEEQRALRTKSCCEFVEASSSIVREQALVYINAARARPNS
jgi:hypothetical protein